MVSFTTNSLDGWRRDPVRFVGLLALVVAVAVFLWQLPHFLTGNSTVWPQYANAFGDMLYFSAWGIAVLLVLTALTRTVSLRLLVACWFLGVFALHGLVVAVELPFRDSMGAAEMGIWVAPVVETLALLLVIVAFYALTSYRRGTHPTASDGLLVGFATGAGVAFHEEMTYARLFPIGPGAEYSAVGRMGQDIWWSYVFPLVGWQSFFNTRQFGNGVVGHFTIYHAGWGALLGVGVGLVFVHRHRILAWFAGLAAVAVTYFDHMTANFVTNRPLESPPVVGDLFQAGDVTGVSEFAVYVLLVAMVAAVVTDLLVLRRVASRFGVCPPVHRALRAGRGRADDAGFTGVGSFRRFLGLDVYARTRRAFLTDVYRVEASHTDPSRLGPSASALYETGRTAGLLASVGLVAGVGLAAFATWASTGVAMAPVDSDVLACAGCAPTNRFVGPLVTLLGGGAAAVAVGTMSRPGAVRVPSLEETNDSTALPADTFFDTDTGKLEIHHSVGAVTNVASVSDDGSEGAVHGAVDGMASPGEFALDPDTGEITLVSSSGDDPSIRSPYWESVDPEAVLLQVGRGSTGTASSKSEVDFQVVTDGLALAGESPPDGELLAYDGRTRRHEQNDENPYAFDVQSREEKARIRKLNEEFEQDYVEFVSSASKEEQYKVQEYRKQGYGQGFPAVTDSGSEAGKLAGKVGVAAAKEEPLSIIKAFREFAKGMKKVINKHNEGESKPRTRP